MNPGGPTFREALLALIVFVLIMLAIGVAYWIGWITGEPDPGRSFAS